MRIYTYISRFLSSLSLSLYFLHVFRCIFIYTLRSKAQRKRRVEETRCFGKKHCVLEHSFNPNKIFAVLHGSSTIFSIVFLELFFPRKHDVVNFTLQKVRLPLAKVHIYSCISCIYICIFVFMFFYVNIVCLYISKYVSNFVNYVIDSIISDIYTFVAIVLPLKYPENDRFLTVKIRPWPTRLCWQLATVW